MMHKCRNFEKGCKRNVRKESIVPCSLLNYWQWKIGTEQAN